MEKERQSHRGLSLHLPSLHSRNCALGRAVGQMKKAPMVFGRYGEYYDLIYHDKDYDGECDFLERVFQRYASGPVRSVFEGGCGTGGHALVLARRGYEVVGVDASEVMVGRAVEKAREAGVQADLSVADLRSYHSNARFDAVICMFAVLGYFESNTEVARVLVNLRRLLRDDGLLVFDVWNGLAVLRILPEARMKVVEEEGTRLVRWVQPELDTLNHLCRDTYTLLVTKEDRMLEEVSETHVVRYFFPQEVKYYLETSGFELLGIHPFLDLEGRVDEKVWNMCCIAKAKGGWLDDTRL